MKQKSQTKTNKYSNITLDELEQRADVVEQQADALRKTVLKQLKQAEEKYLELGELVAEIQQRKSNGEAEQNNSEPSRRL